MSHQDNRQEYRLPSRETILIELTSSFENNQPTSEIVICNSVDISANGLQLAIDQPLETGLILNIAIQWKGIPKPINLVTEVKWMFQVEHDGQWMTGLELLESDDSNLQLWKSLIAERLQATSTL